MLRVLNPTGDRGRSAVALAPRPADLDNLRVGVFSNGKPNAANLVRSVYRQLAQVYTFQEPFVIDKWEAGLYTTGAPRSILDQLAACSVVIHGSGD